MAADNNQTSSPSNPTGTASDTSQQDWLELDQQGLGGETLKAKQWTTKRRMVDSSQHVGNIHTGTEKAVELDKSGTLTEETLQNQTPQEGTTSEEIERSDLNFQTSSTVRHSSELFNQNADQGASQNTEATRPENEQQSVVQSSGDDSLVFEKHFETESDDRSAQREQSNSPAAQQAGLTQTATELAGENTSEPASTTEATAATPPPSAPAPSAPVTSTPPQPLPGEEEDDDSETTPVESSASASTLTTVDSHGFEDTSIAIELSSSLTDTDGSESLTITIEGIPTGATLSAGQNLGNGTWELTSDELPDLTLSPPTNSDEDFSLTITATSTESHGGATRSVSEVIDVFLEAVADTPTLEAKPATGNEDTAITLSIDAALSDTDGSETLSAITLTGVPDDAQLSAGSKNDDGSWSLSKDDLEGLQITPGQDSNDDFELNVSVTTTDSNGATSTSDTILPITVKAVADAAIITGTGDTVSEDILQTATGRLTIVDPDADEEAYFDSEIIEGTYGSLAIGEDGEWTYSLNNEADGVQYLDAGDIVTDTITVTSADGTTHDLVMTVNGTNDKPVIDTITATTGTENGSIITGVISANDIDADDSVTFSAAETDGLSFNSDGSFSFDPSNESFQHLGEGETQTVSIAVTATDEHNATDSQNLIITITGTNDAPTVSGAVTLPGGTEDTSQSFTAAQLLANADDIDTNDTLSVENVSVDPSQGVLTNNNNGTFTFTPKSDYSGSVTLTYDVTDSNTSVSTTTEINLEAVADTPELQVVMGDPSSSQTETSYPLTISSNLTDTDGSEALTIIITDLPEGATLSAGTENADGSWTLSGDQLDGLKLTTSSAVTETFDLQVTATATEASNSDRASVSASVAVMPANQAPVGADDSATTSEDNSITVNVLANDTDSNSDPLTITAVAPPTDANGNVIGSTEIVTENGVQQIKFTPNETLDALNEGESSNIQFTYTVSDGQGGTDTATTTIVVQGTDNDLTYVSETAGYRNVVGTYEIDADGNPVSGTVVIDDQNGMAGGTHLADLDPGNYEFFIIANGAGEINDDSVISFDNSGDQPVLLINGEPASHPVYYTEPGFNPDGKDHFQFESDGEGGTYINIEDLPDLGDAAFGDVVLHTNFEMDDRTAVGPLSDSNQTENSVAENAVAGTYTGITATAVDTDGDAVSYSLGDDAGGRFTIDSETGKVTVAEGADIDFESIGSHDITITATSSDGTDTTENYTINVNDVLENAATEDTAATITVDTEFTEGQNNGFSYDTDGARNANNETYNSLTEALNGQNGTNHDAGNLVYKNINGSTWNLDGASDDHMVITGNTNNANIALGDGNNTLVFETDPGENVHVTCGSDVDIIVLPGSQSDYNLDTLNNNDNVLSGQITGPGNMNMTVNNIDCISFGDGTSLGDSSLLPKSDDILLVTGTTADVEPGQLISITVTDSTGATTTAQTTVSDDGSYSVDVNVNSLADGNLNTDVTVTDIAGNIATTDTQVTVPIDDLALSAKLIDGAVEGIEFTTTSGLHGYTEADGSFSFRDGDDITFNVGGVILGTATAEDVASGQTFLQDIADVDRTDLNDEYLENMATFLQSIDENSDAYDGIVVTEEIRDALADADIDLRTATEEEVEHLVEQIGLNYVEEDDAMVHVEDMLVEHTDLTHDEFDEHIDDGDTELEQALASEQKKDGTSSVTGTAAVAATATDAVIQEFNKTTGNDLSLNVPSLTLPGEEEKGESNSEETETVQAEKQEAAVQNQSDALNITDVYGQIQTDILADDDLSHSLPSASLSNLFDEPETVASDETDQDTTDDDSARPDENTQEQATAQPVDAANADNSGIVDTTDQQPETAESAEVLTETDVPETQITDDDETSLSTDALSIDLETESENEKPQANQQEDTSLDRFSADGSAEQTESNGLEQFSANDDSGSAEEMASVDEIDNVEAENADQIEAAGLSADDGIQEELPQESEQVDTNIG